MCQRYKELDSQNDLVLENTQRKKELAKQDVQDLTMCSHTVYVWNWSGNKYKFEANLYLNHLKTHSMSFMNLIQNSEFTQIFRQQNGGSSRWLTPRLQFATQNKSFVAKLKVKVERNFETQSMTKFTAPVSYPNQQCQGPPSAMAHRSSQKGRLAFSELLHFRQQQHQP